MEPVTTPVFAPRLLTREEVTAMFTSAMREIEIRLLKGHINHLINPVLEAHYDEGGAAEEGEKILGALTGGLEETLKVFNPSA